MFLPLSPDLKVRTRFFRKRIGIYRYTVQFPISPRLNEDSIISDRAEFRRASELNRAVFVVGENARSS